MVELYSNESVFRGHTDKVCDQISSAILDACLVQDKKTRAGIEVVGDELTSEKIDTLIATHPDITVFGLMGGDSDHNDCIRVAKYVHEKYPQLKVGMYSGREFINLDLAQHLDLYKIGRWITPKGAVEDWHKSNNGVLQFP